MYTKVGVYFLLQGTIPLGELNHILSIQPDMKAVLTVFVHNYDKRILHSVFCAMIHTVLSNNHLAVKWICWNVGVLPTSWKSEKPLTHECAPFCTHSNSPHPI